MQMKGPHYLSALKFKGTILLLLRTVAKCYRFNCENVVWGLTLDVLSGPK